MVPESRRYIIAHVVFQWLSLLANIGMVLSVMHLFQQMSEEKNILETLPLTIVVALFSLLVRFICTKAAGRMAFLSAKAVKEKFRVLIFDKLLRLGLSSENRPSTAGIVQVSVEGVEQLESYFGAYLPHFFYSMLAPLTLFVALSFINLPAAAVLLAIVPLIPLTIAAVQTFAKKLLGRYWGVYTDLGDSFLENLQGLTTLKIYRTDDLRHKEMNRQAEHFRKMTMRVLTMQLNSITVMDILAYGGAALGALLAMMQLRAGQVSFAGALAIVLLSADYYIPLRLLGSYFHIAMNGMAASERIFELLEMEEPKQGTAELSGGFDIVCRDLRFAYEEDRDVLKGLDVAFPQGSFSAIVGPSGCGKSTLAALLTGRAGGYGGSILLNDIERETISEQSLMRSFCYVGFDSYIFKGTVRDNLLMASPGADDTALWQVLERVKLSDFLRSVSGLETALLEQGSNFSGGQRQRLALARALLLDSPVYIFDEATSNVDVQSEEDIMVQIEQLAGTKTVILITHRLQNAKNAEEIFVMDDGLIVERGSHGYLLLEQGLYASLWDTQQELECFSERVAVYEA